MNWPGGRRGQLLALGLLAGASVLAWFGMASPLLGLHNAWQQKLALRQMLATRSAGLVATLPQLRRDAAAPGQALGPEALVEGATDAVAAAALQTKLQAMAAEAGVRLTSVEALNAEAAGAFRRIGLRVALQAPLPVLVSLMQTVHEASPRILLDDLQVRVALVLRGQVSPLEVSFTVLAFRASSAETATR